MLVQCTNGGVPAKPYVYSLESNDNGVWVTIIIWTLKLLFGHSICGDCHFTDTANIVMFIIYCVTISASSCLDVCNQGQACILWG